MGVLPMSVQTQTLHVGDNDFEVCDTSHVEGAEALPHSLRILLENVLRNVDDADALGATDQLVHIKDGRGVVHAAPVGHRDHRERGDA